MNTLHLFQFPSTAAAFFGGAALVLLMLMLVMGATAPKHAQPVIPFFDVTPCKSGSGQRLLAWETKGALVTLLHRTGEEHAWEVPAKGSRIVTGGRWALVAVAADGSRVTRSVVVSHVINGKPSLKSAAGAVLALALVVLGNLGCSGNVQQLRQPRILSLKAEPAQVPLGDAALLTWATENAVRLTLEPGGDVTGKLQQRVHPLGSTTYVLTAYSADGLVDRRSLEVPVYAQAAAEVKP